MAEYTANAIQAVSASHNVVFTDTVANCNKGYIIHRPGSGIVTLRGITNQCKARYKVSFGGNIAIPTGQVSRAISVAIALNGEPVQTTTATVTPAEPNQYFNVFTAIYIDVPKGCCYTVSVQNTGAMLPIDVQNANLIVERLS